MDTGTLERALAGAGLQADVRWQEVTGSTNEVAARMAAEGAPDWSLAAAGHQTAGRGRLGRTWSDVAGGALMCSLILRPTGLDPTLGGWIPLMAGVALAEACREVTDLAVRCKWPNDLLLEEGKVAGVLVESQVIDGRIGLAVVGVGLNLAAPPIEGAAGIGREADQERLLISYLRRFAGLYLIEDPEFSATVSSRWCALSSTIGHEVVATMADGGEVRGVAVGLDALGGLIVESSGGRVTVGSGGIAHLG